MLSFRKIFWLNVAIVIIVAFNLRAPITAIGPMIDIIQDEYNLNSTLAGVLTSLPLIAFGSISFIVGYFSPICAIIVGIFSYFYRRTYSFLFRCLWFIFRNAWYRLWYSYCQCVIAKFY